MARLTDRQKLSRVLEWLTGLSHPEVRARLSAQCGFSDEDEAELWQLLRDAVAVFHRDDDVRESVGVLLSPLDAWENRWFPIVSAVLSSRYPIVAKKVLHNLRQISGPTLLVSVTILIERIEALARSTDATEREARKLLERRGLTSTVLDEARREIERAKAPTRDLGPARKGKPALTRAEAIEALWTVYLEWSRLSRTAIHERRLLRVLGFRE